MNSQSKNTIRKRIKEAKKDLEQVKKGSIAYDHIKAEIKTLKKYLK